MTERTSTRWQMAIRIDRLRSEWGGLVDERGRLIEAMKDWKEWEETADAFVDLWDSHIEALAALLDELSEIGAFIDKAGGAFKEHSAPLPEDLDSYFSRFADLSLKAAGHARDLKRIKTVVKMMAALEDVMQELRSCSDREGESYHSIVSRLLATERITRRSMADLTGSDRGPLYSDIPALDEQNRLASEHFTSLHRNDRLARRRALTPIGKQNPHECAAESCARDRVFFDEDGRGYCKRHAEEQGIRPRGKIT